jgi:hypothetical protein
MNWRILVVILALSLLGARTGVATAGVLGYSLDRAGMKSFTEAPREEPSGAVVAADALIARPIGLGLTIAGTATFLVTLPMSACSGSTDVAADGLIVKPGGYTFVRPFGQSEPRFEERTLFGR